MNKLKPCLLIGLLLALPLFALRITAKQDYVKAQASGAVKYVKKSFTLTPQESAFLHEKCNVPMPDQEQSFILGRAADNKVTGAVFFLTIFATEHQCVHHLGIAVAPDGSVKDVTITEAFCEYVLRCSSRSFLGQYGASPKPLFKLNEDVSAVTGATMSCKAITEAVNFTLSAYRSRVMETP